MNKSKWMSKGIPMETCALKLAEEVGEVSNILTDAMLTDESGYAGERRLSKKERKHLEEELEHVIFIAEMMVQRLRTEKR